MNPELSVPPPIPDVTSRTVWKRDLPSDVKKWRQATGKPLQIPVTEGTVGHINAATSPSEYFLQRKKTINLKIQRNI